MAVYILRCGCCGYGREWDDRRLDVMPSICPDCGEELEENEVPRPSRINALKPNEGHGQLFKR